MNRKPHDPSASRECMDCYQAICRNAENCAILKYGQAEEQTLRKRTAMILASDHASIIQLVEICLRHLSLVKSCELHDSVRLLESALQEIAALKESSKAVSQQIDSTKRELQRLLQENELLRLELLNTYDTDKVPAAIELDIAFTKQLVLTMKSKAEALHSVALSQKYSEEEVKKRIQRRTLLLNQISEATCQLENETEELKSLQSLPVTVHRKYQRLCEKAAEREEFLSRLNQSV